MRLARALLDDPSISSVESMLNHEPSWWLRRRLAQIDQAALNGRVEVCGHRTPGVPPILALWAPDAAWCVRCAGAALRLEGPENYQCDRCGVHADPIRVCTIAGRRVVVVFGLCAVCHRKEVAR